MQCAVIEFARNVLKWENANSTEVDPTTKHPVVRLTLIPISFFFFPHRGRGVLDNPSSVKPFPLNPHKTFRSVSQGGHIKIKLRGGSY